MGALFIYPLYSMNIPKSAFLAISTLALTLLPGCVLIKKALPPMPWNAPPGSPTAQDVVISSEPLVGANVWIDGNPSGVTPLVATFDTGKDYNITLMLPGYDIKTIRVMAGSHGRDTYISKAGSTGYEVLRGFPSSIDIQLMPATNSVKALEKAVASLDEQLRNKEITPDQHKALVQQAIATYHQSP
jgi:hypothetical protein